MKKLNYLSSNSINMNLSFVEDESKLSYSQTYSMNAFYFKPKHSTWNSLLLVEVRIRGLAFCNVKNNNSFKDILQSKRLKSKIFKLICGTYVNKDKDYKIKVFNEIVEKIDEFLKS